MNRIDRLTAILIQLQSKRIVKAEEIANRFEISLRTVYRDVKALMEAGVPIGSEAGKGYFIVDGYYLPPVMFTQSEAGALLLAGKFIEKMSDKSIRDAFDSAMFKIKAVLKEDEKEHLENLQEHIQVFNRPRAGSEPTAGFPNHFITDIQRAVVGKLVVQLEYVSQKEESSSRLAEPIGLYYYNDAWHLIAWCRLRSDYRDFKVNRIKSLQLLSESFKGRSHVTLQEYFQSIMQENASLAKVSVLFDKRYLSGRPLYGSISQTDLGERVRVEIMMDNLSLMAKWLLSFGAAATVEAPVELKTQLRKEIDLLAKHHG